MLFWGKRKEANQLNSFGKQRRAFRLVAIIAGASLLVSCANQFRYHPSEKATSVYSKWLAERPRTIVISAETEPLILKYKKTVRREYEIVKLNPLMSGNMSGGGNCGGNVAGCVVGLAIVIPLALIFSALASGKRTKIYESQEGLDVSSLKESAAKIRASFMHVNFAGSLAEKFSEIGKKTKKANLRISVNPVVDQWGYPAKSSEALLIFAVKRLQLLSDEKSQHEMRLQVSISADMKTQVDGVYCTFSSDVLSHESETKNIDSWVVKNAAIFKQELRNAINALATKAAIQLFVTPHQQTIDCDFENSPAAQDLQKNWKREIRDTLVPGSSTRKEVLATLPAENLEASDPASEKELIYLFHEPSITPLTKGELEWRQLQVVFDENDVVKYVWTYLDADTAIHRIHKIKVGKTTKEQALRVLGEPPFNLNPKLRPKVHYADPGTWALELLFDSNNVVKHIYQKKGDSIDLKAACEAARLGSRTAQKDLGDHYYPWPGNSLSDAIKSYKWYRVLKLNGGSDYTQTINSKSLTKKAIAIAARQAKSWPSGICP